MKTHLTFELFFTLSSTTFANEITSCPQNPVGGLIQTGLIEFTNTQQC